MLSPQILLAIDTTATEMVKGKKRAVQREMGGNNPSIDDVLVFYKNRLGHDKVSEIL